MGTEGFLVSGTRPGLSAGSLRALSGRALSPAGPLVLAATDAALGAAEEEELGLGGALRLRPGLARLGGCLVRGGRASGSTMQMPGTSGRGGGTRGVGSGSLAAPSLPASSSESAAGTGSESDSVGSDSLTDVGGVSGGRSCERALLSELPGDAGRGGLRCANSQGDTRHRSTSCGDVERRARRRGRLSPGSPAGRTCSKDTDRDSSTSVECGEPSSAGSEGVVRVGVVAVGVVAEGDASSAGSGRSGLRDRRSGLLPGTLGGGDRAGDRVGDGAGGRSGSRLLPASPGLSGKRAIGGPEGTRARGPFCAVRGFVLATPGPDRRTSRTAGRVGPGFASFLRSREG